MKKLVPIASITLPIALLLSGCDTPGQSAGLGAAIGGAFGALASRGRPWGVLQGAALGAATGYVVGKVVQHDRREEDYYDDDPYYRDHDYRDRDFPIDSRTGLPVARPSHHEGFVISPYPPHNRIDVRDIPSGAKVMDPSTNHVFINP
jgi:Glycine zipper